MVGEVRLAQLLLSQPVLLADEFLKEFGGVGTGVKGLGVPLGELGV